MDARFFHRTARPTWLPTPRPPPRRRVSGGGMPTPEALAALVARVAGARDRAAFAALFDHFAPRVKSYMQRLGASGEQAEELAQEALLLVWHKAAQFDPARAGAATWVFTIARNLRIDALRRERPAEALDAAAIERVADEGPAADTLLATGEAERALRAALVTLSPDQAELLRLSFFEDSPHSAISAQLSLPLGTVKSRLRRILAQLRAAMEAGR